MFLAYDMPKYSYFVQSFSSSSSSGSNSNCNCSLDMRGGEWKADKEEKEKKTEENDSREGNITDASQVDPLGRIPKEVLDAWLEAT